MQSGYSGFIYLIVAALIFLVIRMTSDYIVGSRHYLIEFEKKSETVQGKKPSPEEFMDVIDKAYEANDAKHATAGLPVLVEELNFSQENSKISLSTDEVDYGLNQLVEQGKIVRYKNLLAYSRNGEGSIGGYYIYELAMNKNSYTIQKNYKKMLTANRIIMAKNIDDLNNNSEISVITIGLEEANSLRKKIYSYDSRCGYLLFLLSSGLMRCIEA